MKMPRYANTGAFRKCVSLHSRKINEIRVADMQAILDDHTLSHAYMEHITNLLHQVFKYAAEYNIIDKDYSHYIKITKAEDDEAGIPFTKEELHLLWQNANTVPYTDTVLILTYTGWRITELLTMRTDNVSLTEWTMMGGVKTSAGKNRGCTHTSRYPTPCRAVLLSRQPAFLKQSGQSSLSQKQRITSCLTPLYPDAASLQDIPHATAGIPSHPSWIPLEQTRYVLIA